MSNSSAVPRILCPCCGSDKVGGTKPGESRYSTECFVCYNDFNPAASIPIEPSPSATDIEELLDRFDWAVRRRTNIRPPLGSREEAVAARSSLRARFSEMEQDKERLDWLEARGCVELSLNKADSRAEWFDVSQGEDEQGRGSSLREAIDAARSTQGDTAQ